MYTGFERLWNALALFGLGAEAFGVDGNFDGNKFFCYYSFLTRRSSSFVFRVSDCHQVFQENGNPSRLPFFFCQMCFSNVAPLSSNALRLSLSYDAIWSCADVVFLFY